jgi:hypothetical protein
MLLSRTDVMLSQVLDAQLLLLLIELSKMREYEWCFWKPTDCIRISVTNRSMIRDCCHHTPPPPPHPQVLLRALYTRKNAQVDAILTKTGLNNALLPTLFTVVNNIEQYCYTRFRLNNIVQYCWQVWTTWAAKHCSILLSSGLGVFCRVWISISGNFPQDWCLISLTTTKSRYDEGKLKLSLF